MFGQAVPMLAHQGGWDEMLLVVIPIGLFAGLLVLANRRANAKLREKAATEVDPGTDHEAGPAEPLQG